MRYISYLIILLSLAIALCKDESAAQDKSKGQKTDERIFSTAKESRYIFKAHRYLYRVGGSQKVKDKYNTTPMEKTVVMQSSVRKRLYDHNIFLRGLFSGRVIHNTHGNLGKIMDGAVFFDFGSAILYAEGAVTVRDVFEDPNLKPHLRAVVASDINDYSSPKTQFVNIYRKEHNNLPFPVEEIPMALVKADQVRKILKAHVAGPQTPVIFRAINGGMDHFYTADQLRQHFIAVLSECYQRPVVYLFNRFVFFKAANSGVFEIIGEETMMAQLQGMPWTKVNWATRDITDGFKPVKALVSVKPKK